MFSYPSNDYDRLKAIGNLARLLAGQRLNHERRYERVVWLAEMLRGWMVWASPDVMTNLVSLYLLLYTVYERQEQKTHADVKDALYWFADTCDQVAATFEDKTVLDRSRVAAAAKDISEFVLSSWNKQPDWDGIDF